MLGQRGIRAQLVDAARQIALERKAGIVRDAEAEDLSHDWSS